MAAKSRKMSQEESGKAEEILALREVVLEKLLQLHVDFGMLGRLPQAGPQLYKLMELAYYVQPPVKNDQEARVKARLRKRDIKLLKSSLN